MSGSSPTPTTPSPARGYLDNTVLVITFDEWGGFFDHVRPPQVIDDTNPATVDHTGNSTTPTDGQLVPNYRQLGFRVPAIVVSNLAATRIAHSHAAGCKQRKSSAPVRQPAGWHRDEWTYVGLVTEAAACGVRWAC